MIEKRFSGLWSTKRLRDEAGAKTLSVVQDNFLIYLPKLSYVSHGLILPSAKSHFSQTCLLLTSSICAESLRPCVAAEKEIFAVPAAPWKELRERSCS